MLTPSDHVRDLIIKYMQGTVTAAEKRELDQLLEQFSNEELALILEPVAESTKKDPAYKAEDWETTMQFILQHPAEDQAPARIVRLASWKKIVAAASILIILGSALYLLLQRSPEKSEDTITATAPQEQRFKNDVAPGTDKAVLIMADGREVILEGKGNETLTEKNGSRIRNTEGILSYEDGKTKSGEVVYHTLQIPRKGEYELILADGSTVKLNAESSIYYPTAFPGSERKVQVTGEAYFEIAKNAAKPFIVSVKGMDIKVLGTHFNINAYENETSIRTTLLEGNIEVTNGIKTVSVKPNQQVQLKKDGAMVVTDDVNIMETVAWTSGFFQFNNSDIETVMRQVTRWYDVEVSFKGNISQRFNGRIPRTVQVSDIFKILESTGWVHFMIDGNKVSVMP